MPAPLEAVTARDPYPYYATLVAERPLYHDDELQAWVASGAGAVEALLHHPACRVRPPAQPVPEGIDGSAAGEVFGSLVRMTDGDVQRTRKHAVVEALAEARADRVAALAAEHAQAALAGSTERRLQDLMLAVPARTVASLCGLDATSGAQAARLTGDFVGCIPATATRPQQEVAARAAQGLQELLSPLMSVASDGPLGVLARAAARSGAGAGPMLANAIGLLSQTYDATAGLVGNTLVALAGDGARPSGEPLERYVREVARHDSPVQNTRRFTVAPVRVDGVLIPAGQAILLVLAAANRDPAANPDPHAFLPDRPRPALFGFGAGTHRCPGETVAFAIATAVVGELLASDFEPRELPEDVSYRPSPNARIPIL